MTSTKQIKVSHQGGFGCITKPSMECESTCGNTNITSADYSKIQTTEDTDKEATENKEIDEIDKNSYYHMPTLCTCTPKVQDTEFQVLKDECTIPYTLKHILGLPSKEFLKLNTKLTLMNDGGQSWLDFSERNDLSSENIKDFLVNSYNVVRGIQHMLDNGFIHDDIKTMNLLYCKTKKRSNIIDFGRSGKLQSFIENRKNSYIHEGTFLWWAYEAPDRFFQCLLIFTNAQGQLRHALDGNPSHNVNVFKQAGHGYSFYINNLTVLELQALTSIIDLDMYRILQQVRDSQNLDEFLKKTLGVMDVFGMTFALVQVTFNFLKAPRDTRDPNDVEVDSLIRNIRKLAIEASRIDPQERMSPKRFACRYEECILNTLTNKEDLAKRETTTLLLQNIRDRYPKDNSQDLSVFQESKLVSEYEDVLRLDLLEFVKNGHFQDPHIIKKLKEDVDVYLSQIINNNKNLNLREPQIWSELSKIKQCSYINLLGSTYCVCVCNTNDPLLQGYEKGSEKLLFISIEPYGLIVKWKTNKIFLPLVKKIPTELDIHYTDASRLSRIIEQQLLDCILKVTNLNHMGWGLIIELVCLTLVEIHVPGIVTRLLGIICEPALKNKINSVNLFERTLSRFLNVVLSAQIKNKHQFHEAYNYRIYLSVLRGGIASADSQVLLIFRELLGFKPSKKMYRDHQKVLEIQEFFNSKTVLPENAIAFLECAQEGVKEQKKEACSSIRHLKIGKHFDAMVAGMDPSDIVFTYRNIDYKVSHILAMVNNNKDNGLIADFVKTTERYFVDDVADRINKTSSRKDYITVYTQLQIDAMLLMPQNFGVQISDLVEFMVKNTENQVYVIFESGLLKAQDNDQRYLVHGFSVRGINKNSSGNSANEYTWEIVIRVPEPCIFQVLEPVTWNFVSKLREVLQKDYKTSEVTFIKEPNHLLSKYIYQDKNIYTFMEKALMQTEMIANDKTNLIITKDCFKCWCNYQKKYFFKQVFV